MIPIHKEIMEEVVALRRFFHQNPELGGEEFLTADKIAGTLEKMGLQVKTGIAGTGVMGFLAGGKPGKNVLLRADMDALPIQDKKEVSYASKMVGKMHACGHDAHMAILLGVAMCLQKMKEELAGTVKFLFQPKEETTGGARDMIEAGVMDDFSPSQYALALHVDPQQPTGEISLSYGISSASSQMLTVHLLGASSHGVLPHLGVDALLMAGQFLSMYKGIVTNSMGPHEPVILSFGTVQGGEASNIIAQEVVLEGILRTLKPSIQEKVLEKLTHYLNGLSLAYGGDYRLQIQPGYPSLKNDAYLATVMEKVAGRMLGKEKVHIMKQPGMGVDDFAYFLQEVPGLMWRLGCGKGEEQMRPIHSPLFDVDERALGIGVELQSAMVRHLLKGDGLDES